MTEKTITDKMEQMIEEKFKGIEVPEDIMQNEQWIEKEISYTIHDQYFRGYDEDKLNVRLDFNGTYLTKSGSKIEVSSEINISPDYDMYIFDEDDLKDLKKLLDKDAWSIFSYQSSIYSDDLDISINYDTQDFMEYSIDDYAGQVDTTDLYNILDLLVSRTTGQFFEAEYLNFVVENIEKLEKYYDDNYLNVQDYIKFEITSNVYQDGSMDIQEDLLIDDKDFDSVLTALERDDVEYFENMEDEDEDED